MSEEEFDDGTASQPLGLTEDVMDRLQRYGVELRSGEVRARLDLVPSAVSGALSDEARNLLAQELAAMAMHRAGLRVRQRFIVGRDIELAAKQIGARIRSGSGEFSRLSQADRQVMLDGCPWC